MTHPVTQHSDSCCCSRCDQVEPDVGALHARIAELEHLLAAERLAATAGRGAFEAAVRAEARSGERLAKLEAALEWAAKEDILVRTHDVVLVNYDQYDGGYTVLDTQDHDGAGPSIINALIALHERAGK